MATGSTGARSAALMQCRPVFDGSGGALGVYTPEVSSHRPGCISWGNLSAANATAIHPNAHRPSVNTLFVAIRRSPPGRKAHAAPDRLECHLRQSATQIGRASCRERV